jgi:hypothetical protein
MSTRLVRTCAICGGGPTELHHPTCRIGPGLPYLDPALRLVLCSGGSVHDHHGRIGEALRDLGLDFLPAGMDPLVYRVKLLVIHAGFFADCGKAFTLADAAASRALQGFFLDILDALTTLRETAA